MSSEGAEDVDMAIDDLALALEMRRMLYGQLLSRALCAVAALGIPEMLAAGPRTVDYLARRSGTRSGTLHQVLRALSAFGVFVDKGNGTFALTPLGATLQSDAVASALPTAMLVGSEIGQAWNQMLLSMRTERPAFEKVYGVSFFDYIDSKPELRTIFDRSQAAGLVPDLEEILHTVDLSGRRVVIDIGGGDGELLEHLLTKYPQVNGILVDLPNVTVRACKRLMAAGLAGRFEVCAGDFCEAVPKGGDVYVLRQIMHDLNDERCGALLAACAAAMQDRSRIVIIELVVDEWAISDREAQMTALMDLYMMSIFGGRERTRAEFEALLAAADFKVNAVTRLTGQMMAIEASRA
jgi:cyclopropane fatty-acyl-phospholipid synthase-like methyltransferase